MENAAREVNGLLQSKKMDRDYDSTDRECFSCFYDLHLSAVRCQCSLNRFACLNHANLLCSCEMDRKFVLYRYSMEELKTLVAALEGDPAAVCQWGQDHLGLVCQSGSMQQKKMGLGKSTELSGFVIDANIGCSLDDCNDLDKPAGYQKWKGIQNKCVDLNIEDPSSSPRIKKELVCSSGPSGTSNAASSTSIALEKNDRDKMVINYESVGTTSKLISLNSCSLSLNYSSELPSPSTISTVNSSPPSKTTEKLFGVEIEYNAVKPSDCQVMQLASPSLNQSDEVSRSTILRHPVELLDHGSVMVGKRWCNHQAIFPKGFKSRVTFHSVLDPTRTCSYVSEVFDAGLLGPLFRVTVEEFPEVSFTHTSPMQCWESVRDRVNEEIEKQHRLVKSGTPALLSPNSINGLEMFGFLFPPIIQVIEALDPHHQCLEYWSLKLKRTSPVKEPPSESMMAAMVNGTNSSPIRLLGVDITRNEAEQSSFRNNSCAEEVTLGRLLKKAKLPEEPEFVAANRVFSSRVDSSSIRSGSCHSAGWMKKNVGT